MRQIDKANGGAIGVIVQWGISMGAYVGAHVNDADIDGAAGQWWRSIPASKPCRHGNTGLAGVMAGRYPTDLTCHGIQALLARGR